MNVEEEQGAVLTRYRWGIALLLTAFILVLLFRSYGPTIARAQTRVLFNPFVDNFHGVDFLWQRPEGDPQGLVLAFHGCRHDPQDWFTVAESQALAREILSHQFILVAIAPTHKSGCFDADFATGIVRLAPFLRHLNDHPAFRQATPLPVFGIGISSGAAFLSRLIGAPELTFDFHFAAIALYIMGIPSHAIENAVAAQRPWPPTVVGMSFSFRTSFFEPFF
jgi:poly(3-hydroxybutyrate) depolymerase